MPQPTVHPALPVREHDGRRLDWRPRFDPASRRYAAAPGVQQLPARGRLWLPGRQRLDQGAEGACTGFSAAGELAAQPVPVPRVTNRYARGLYLGARRRDEWPGEQYEGSSILGVLKELKARGLILEFRWSFSAVQLLWTVAQPEEEGGGPALAGVEWRQGSYSTDELGVLRPSGPVVGGHALAVVGAVVQADLDEQDSELLRQLEDLDLLDGVRAVLEDDGEDAAAIVLNSWGPTFGMNGLCVVPLSTLDAWVEARAEFGHPVGRRLPQQKGTTVAEQDEQDPVELESVTVTEPGADQEPAAEPEDQEPAPESADGTTTLHVTAGELEPRDRVFLPDDVQRDLGVESTTVRSTQCVRGVVRLVRVHSPAGTFTLTGSTVLKVRRPE